MSTGAVCIPVSHRSGGPSAVGGVACSQKAARCAGVRSTTKSQPCEKPALGARMAASRQVSTAESGTGRSGS